MNTKLRFTWGASFWAGKPEVIGGKNPDWEQQDRGSDGRFGNTSANTPKDEVFNSPGSIEKTLENIRDSIRGTGEDAPDVREQAEASRSKRYVYHMTTKERLGFIKAQGVRWQDDYSRGSLMGDPRQLQGHVYVFDNVFAALSDAWSSIFAGSDDLVLLQLDVEGRELVEDPHLDNQLRYNMSSYGIDGGIDPDKILDSKPITDGDLDIITPVGRGDLARGVAQSSLGNRDAEYVKAIKDGDLAKAREMLNERAGELGYNIGPLTHGTTYDFDEFKKEFALATGNFGAGFYFTNADYDAEENYAKVGGDLLMKIEMRVEEIIHGAYEEAEIMSEELEEDPDAWAVRLEALRTAAYVKAKSELVGDSPRTIEAYIGLKNPITVGGNDETFFDREYVYDEGEVDYDEDEDREPEIIEIKGKLIEFRDSLLRIVEDDSFVWGAVNDLFLDITVEWFGETEGVVASDLMVALRESALGQYTNPDDGELYAEEALRSALEDIGFDGIIDKSVDSKFGSQSRFAQVGMGMAGMDADTVHTIVFKPEAIKAYALETLDSQGNPVPLSERFDRSSKKLYKNPDWRQQARGNDGRFGSTSSGEPFAIIVSKY